MEIASRIELTLLRPDATRELVLRGCAEARAHSFHGICLHGSWVAEARHALDGSSIKVVTVVGFPLGGASSDAKRYETEVAVDDGTHEIDVVLNAGRLKDGDDRYVLRELRDVIEAADERPVKAMFESSLLSMEEKRRACHLAVEAGAAFVSTSTGLGRADTLLDDLQILVQSVSGACGVKVAGNITDRAFALALIKAGATRLGTSAGTRLVTP